MFFVLVPGLADSREFVDFSRLGSGRVLACRHFRSLIGDLVGVKGGC